MKNKKVGKIGLILGIIAGLLMILTGILTALEITPAIAAVGLEVGLGIWRIIAGVIVLIFSFIMAKHKTASFLVIILGAFEVVVFIVEKDYSILTAAPFIAILAGILGLVKK
ncbi:MAG: hypothetical protein IIA87_01175 [Nanoarchaeota archaeon]|nr:hypothetical protein [Nanoarchaeota archaeon]